MSAKGSGFTIRTSLSALVVTCIVPTLVTTIFLVFHAYDSERLRSDQRRVETARALMQAVDRELSSGEGTLEALATSPYLTSGDLQSFRAQLEDVQRYRPNNNFVLSDGNGQQLINTLLTPGSVLPRHGNPEQLRKVFEIGKPVISDLYLGGVTRRPIISIDVPVIRGNKVVYDLSMGFQPAYLGEILQVQRVPSDRLIAIFDSKGVAVARTWLPERYVGHMGAPQLVKRMQEVAEDSIDNVSVEGIPLVSSFSRSSVSNWTVAIGVTKQANLHQLWLSIGWIAGVAALSMLAGLALAALLAERIRRPIHALQAPAEALGLGKPVTMPTLRLKEANDVAQVLVKASQLLRQRTDERDLAAKAEREMRTIKQRLEHSEAFQRRIFEEAPNAIILVEPSGRIVRANAEAERVFGYSGEELLRLRVEDLVPEESTGRHQALRESYSEHPARRPMGTDGNLYGRRADGSVFPVDVMLSPLQLSEGTLTIATVRDITDLRRHEEQLGSALREKETLLKELYHRVKNNLQVIASMISLQERSMAGDATRIALKEAADRVSAMALVHEKLYQSGNLSSIALDEYIADLCKRLGDAAGAGEHGIRLDTEVEAVQIGLDLAVPLGLVLNELVSNCLKHAFPGGRQGRILVRLERMAMHAMRLTVADDGVGLPPGMTPAASTTLGLKLVTALAAQLDAEFSLESQQGTVATFTFPIPGQERI
ncbi:MAG TPA: histidine kinase dimerization/phosphoacceptor domain -containing protein [Noviherbaspirillum sp.]|uniref:sensor histidine kinase n=1 Tax=Noviherbaspirillum sp. TaxID=1926288 RepID=UPI002B48C08F|nr:histidine kinase dimerization/phosphoacceptor domain -containing protein [Noviherbaspirillum sp.]HJV86414.1 histidine kinase dimerization/phosphoacceptor domain -containing protein [Noviherbaspirillum sp.]